MMKHIFKLGIVGAVVASSGVASAICLPAEYPHGQGKAENLIFSGEDTMVWFQNGAMGTIFQLNGHKFVVAADHATPPVAAAYFADAPSQGVLMHQIYATRDVAIFERADGAAIQNSAIQFPSSGYVEGQPLWAAALAFSKTGNTRGDSMTNLYVDPSRVAPAGALAPLPNADFQIQLEDVVDDTKTVSGFKSSGSALTDGYAVLFRLGYNKLNGCNDPWGALPQPCSSSACPEFDLVAFGAGLYSDLFVVFNAPKSGGGTHRDGLLAALQPPLPPLPPAAPPAEGAAGGTPQGGVQPVNVNMNVTVPAGATLVTTMNTNTTSVLSTGATIKNSNGTIASGVTSITAPGDSVASTALKTVSSAMILQAAPVLGTQSNAWYLLPAGGGGAR